MAKQQRKKFRKNEEPMTIAKIYETIKTRDFLQDLWYDLISDIKEKPTYKQLKEMVDAVINNTMEPYNTIPINEQERLRRRTILTEISIMTYTVDTVISQVLYRKLQNEFQSIIGNLVKELQDDRKIRENGESSQLTSSLGNAKSIPNNKPISIKEGETSSLHPKEIQAHLQIKSDTISHNSPGKRGRPKKVKSEIEKVIPEKITQDPNSAPVAKRGRPKKVIPAPTRKRGRLPLIRNRNTKPGSKLGNSSGIEKYEFSSNNADQQVESDAESDISVGKLSIASVSSVHTSELSSFEDTISVEGSEDENGTGKRHVPLKLANDMYLHGKLSEIYDMGKKQEQLKNLLETQAPKDSSVAENTKNANSSSRKVLPQRIRKPNSKYNSETMYCNVKDYSTSQVDEDALNSEEEDAILVQPQRTPKRRKISDEKRERAIPARPVPEIASSNAHSPNKASASSLKLATKLRLSPQKASTKRYESSDLYKPRLTPGTNFSSRGNTSITLYST